MMQPALKRLCSNVAGKRHPLSFITTPIFYVNADPHIGHLYSALLADASHRWHKLKGVEPAIFSTGTDEHGLKVQKAATAQGCSPLQLCDTVSSRFKELFDTACINYTDYIRTTESRHVKMVEEFWQRLYNEGHIYKGTYEGWYSIQEETFLSNSQVTNGSKPGTKESIETGHPVEWSSEQNYLFQLSAFREQLLSWINSEPYPVVPESARRQVVNWLTQETSADLSVSRPRDRLSWGIPTPQDHSQTIYVWLDALVNYLTVSRYPSSAHCWPATAHIVGKDILRFHAIYWPAFLLAAGLPLPQKIISHAHWTMRKSKMSKSKGNVVDPFEQLAKFGVDPLRYFLLKEGSLYHDGDYSEERLAVILNSDLADTLGNLLLRVTSRKVNPNGGRVHFSTKLFPLFGGRTEEARACDEDLALVNKLNELPDLVAGHYETFEFNKGIMSIMDCLHQTNQFLERHKPWQLALVPSDQAWLKTVLAVAIEALRLSSLLLYPIIPGSSEEILRSIGHGLREGAGGEAAATLAGSNGARLQCLLSSDTGLCTLAQTVRLELGGRPLFRKV